MEYLINLMREFSIFYRNHYNTNERQIVDLLNNYYYSGKINRMMKYDGIARSCSILLIPFDAVRRD